MLRQGKVGEHPPRSGKEVWYTIHIHHGGKISWEEKNENLAYEGGEVSSFDYVNILGISVEQIDGLVAQLGLNGPNKYYRLDSCNVLTQIMDGNDLYLSLDFKSFEVHIYVESGDRQSMVVDKGKGKGILKATNNDDKGMGKGKVMGFIVDVEENDFIDGGGGLDEGNNSEGYVDSDDSEFVMSDGGGYSDMDDVLFEEAIDKEAEWCGIVQEDEDNNEQSDESTSVEVEGSEDEDFNSDLGSDDENCVSGLHNSFTSSTVFNPEFWIGQKFSSKQLFKDAIRSHGVVEKRNVKITKNDKRRIYARCLDCEWFINALKVPDEDTYQIRKINNSHTCAVSFHVQILNSTWLSKRYVEDIRADPKKDTDGFRNTIARETRVHVSRHQAYRAKVKAKKLIEGSSEEQYNLIWDYANALRLRNPGSTIKISVDEGAGGRNKFSKFYVCFQALKAGFLSGCRPFIGVDGTFLKGPHGGVLLTAVSIDPNNQIYPIAYAVVTTENTETWTWFLGLLKEDLNIVRDDLYTFMSDRQKSLLAAFEAVLPGCENRFCVKHLHGNMKRAGFRGTALKNALWTAARSTTVPAFDHAMRAIGELDKKCLAWLQERPSSQWSKSHFSTFPKCDLLLNNICESWNSVLVEARQKSIITMLEWIRMSLMKSLQEKRDKCERLWEGKLICPSIREKLNRRMAKASECIPFKSTSLLYEIESFDGGRYSVDLGAKTCSCRLWDLTGVPCRHGMRAIGAEKLNPEEFVHQCYSIHTYNSVYSSTLQPMVGVDMWEKTGYIPPLPPNFGKKRGRPSKARRRGADEEPSGGRKKKKTKELLPMMRKKVKCGWCKRLGHNERTCEWKKFAEQFPNDDSFMEEMPQIDGIPPQTQELQGIPPMEEMTQTDSIQPSTQESQEIPPMDEMTQTDGIPPLTQESQVDMSEIAVPMSSHFIATNESIPFEPPRQVVSRVNIRAPAPMTLHPNENSIMQRGSIMATPSSPVVPLLKVGGQKYVTMTNLQASMVQSSKKKKGGKKK